MNPRTLLSLVLILIVQTAFAATGGVYFVENGRLTCQDLATGKRTSTNIVVDGDFSVAHNSGVKFFSQGQKLMAQANGETSIVTIEAFDRNSTYARKPVFFKKDFSSYGKKITASPSGKRLAWEYQDQGESFVLIGSDGNIPIYQKSMSSFIAISFGEFDRNFFSGKNTWGGKLGNTDCYPRYFPYRLAGEPANLYTGLSTPFVSGSLTLTVDKSVQTHSVCRNAQFGCWSGTEDGSSYQSAGYKTSNTSKEELFAVIYWQPGTQTWGPIEIRRNENPASGKPGVYEIPLASTVPCKGLAWTPGGSLVCWGGNRVIRWNRQDLENGFSQAGVTKNPNQKRTEVIATNNEISAKTEVVASGINGSGIVFLSENEFIFRNEDGSLITWKNGVVEKLLDSIPVKFCYSRIVLGDISQSQPEVIKTSANIVVPKINKEATDLDRKNGIQRKGIPFTKTTIGGVQISTSGYGYDIDTKKTVTNSISVQIEKPVRGSSNKVFYSRIDGCIESLDGSDSIDFLLRNKERELKKNARGDYPSVSLDCGKIVIVRSGNRFLALELCREEPVVRYKIWQDKSVTQVAKKF